MDKVFLTVYFVLLILFNVTVGISLIHWSYIPSLIYFVAMQLFNVQFVHAFTEMLLSLAVRRDHDLPCLERLPHTPAVAILYTTCNDANLKIMEALMHQTYPNYQVFVLDDSTSAEYRALVDRSPFHVVRYSSRRHSKAANINNWLQRYGQDFAYFVILDSDSILPPDFVTQMVRYAEHPLNSKVAIFQSRTRIWNTGNRFARTLAAMEPVWNFPLERLSNRCNMLLPWGHNILCRTEAILQVGGFGEKSMSEDYEIAVRLLQIGYSSKLVNVLSWDAMPEDVDAYAKRSVRWAQGILQIVIGDVGSVPLIVKFRLFMTAYFYLVQVLYVAALFLIVWSYQSSLRNVYILMQFLLTGAFLKTSFWRPLTVIGLYLGFYLVFQPLLARRLGVSFRQYFSHSILGVAVGLYSAGLLASGIWHTLRTGEGLRTLMPKPGVGMITHRSVRPWILTFTFSALMLVGVIRNPISFMFNFMWLLPFLLSPLILYRFRPAPNQTVTDITPAVAQLYPALVKPTCQVLTRKGG